MIVEDMERRFFELKGKLDVGVITEGDFKAQVQKLRFQDQQGRWWMLGAQSGKWYSYDGARWIPGQPPRDVPAPVAPAVTETHEPAPTPPPVVPAAPMTPPVAPTATETFEQISEPSPRIAPAPPPSPEHIVVAPRVRPIA
ncbi:MAG: hypothetical protein AB1817_21075, partial [Chloroflexota bacterium]